MNKKLSIDYIKKLKKELDTGNNFIDYFTVIGLPTDLIFSDFLYENDLSKINGSEKLKPEILSKFPPFPKSTISIDENIIIHCFPNGYNIKESQSPPPIESFGFVLDNNLYSISYPQKFISCLICYESLETYYKLYQLHRNFDDKNKGEFIIDEKNFIVKRSEKYSISRPNYKSEFSKLNNESNIENYFQEDKIKRGRKPSHQNMSNLKLKFDSKSYLKNFYVQKCICFASLHPFFMEFRKILKTIYLFSKAGRVIKPLEKIIESLILEVPAPPRGIWKVQVEIINDKFDLKQPPMNQLPLIWVELEIIFFKFNIDDILEIFKHILIETRIIFFSQDISLLTPIVEGFLSLIYPLKYSFQHVTILPQESLKILDSIQPYVVGINQKYDDNFFDINYLDLTDVSYMIVDIDLKKIKLKPSRKKINDNYYFPDLPKKYRLKLIKNIQSYIEKIKYNEKKEDRENFVRNILQHFFQFFVNIFQDYSNFLNHSYFTNQSVGSPTIKNLFKVDEFLNYVKKNDMLFYAKIVETQMFVELILKRMTPKDSKDKIEILFFDEHIIEKKNRKFFSKKNPTPFLQSKVYDYKNIYPVRKSNFTIDNSHFKKLDNIKEALKYGQEIHFNNDEISISYHIFPILMNHVYFKPEERNFIIPTKLLEEVENANIEIASKSYLSTINQQFNEMENCIYLCWIQLWSMVFWYHDEIEKRYRFQQLLGILDKVKMHEMETFNLLFEVLSKYGEDYMIFKLYNKLIFDYKLNPNYLMCTMVMRLIEKKNNFNNAKQNNNYNILEFLEKYDFNQEWDVTMFRKRIFLTKKECHILTNEVNFNLEYNCMLCSHPINLEKLTKSLSTMRRGLEWAKCPNDQCKYPFLPKVYVRLGIELNKDNSLKFNTSVLDHVVLYSPLFLKINYNIDLIKEFHLKLDLENFRHNFKFIFWDSVFYFNLMDLDYEFFLPYEDFFNLNEYNKINSHLIIENIRDDLNQAIEEENEIQRIFSIEKVIPKVEKRERSDSLFFDQIKDRHSFSVSKQINHSIIKSNTIHYSSINYLHSIKDIFNEDKNFFNANDASEKINYFNTSEDIKKDADFIEIADSEQDKNKIRKSNEEFLSPINIEKNDFSNTKISLNNINLEDKKLEVDEEFINDISTLEKEIKIVEVCNIKDKDHIEKKNEIRNELNLRTYNFKEKLNETFDE